MATSSESTVGEDRVYIDLADCYKKYYCSPCQKDKIDQLAEWYCKKCKYCLIYYCANCVINHNTKFKKHKPYGIADKDKWPFPKKEFQDVLQKHGLHEDLCKDLGTLCERKCAEVSAQGDSDQVISVRQISRYNVSLPSDSHAFLDIGAICDLSDDQILVADRFSKRVKLLNDQYQVVGHCDLTVWDMCKISPSEVAVILYPDSIGARWTDEVHFVSVNGWRLVKGRKLQFQHHCKGIAHDQRDLYVTSGTALYKYSMSGDLLKKLYENTTDNLPVYKCAVSPSGDRIFVTSNLYKVRTLARDGTVLHTFIDPDLKYPHGIHVTDLGQVLVCDNWGGSDTIIQLDTEGKKKLATIATVKSPRSVSFNRSTASIIVGQFYSTTILVFKVK
ncbi:uncharacterized protein LOC127855393 [Dreissena polymorpha]|uniref:uncharacterized protein LOC127855393 n=1 Tax=Dreissena polymorpha TaxID=45954 RepID=UPI00226545AB|nr:uncharacterized protein LOC127855393 [Dreissena polymorpha]